jgi:hypothetical protein
MHGGAPGIVSMSMRRDRRKIFARVRLHMGDIYNKAWNFIILSMGSHR